MSLKSQPFSGTDTDFLNTGSSHRTGDSLPPTPTTVGIVTSAGGYEAIEQILTALPTDCDLSFVVVMHLKKDRPSFLIDLVRQCTSMPVQLATDGMVCRPNNIHVVPPGSEPVVSGGRLQMNGAGGEESSHHPINRFFSSLAAEFGPRAIAVILTDLQTDGTEGAKRVHGAGGTVFIRRPETEDNAFLPLNTIDQGAADFFLSSQEIADALMQVADGRCLFPSGAVLDEKLHTLFTILEARTGHDFSSYKRNTVLRRIERRMAVNMLKELDKYLVVLENNPEEAQALRQDLLIGMTNFFRDPEAFDFLSNEIIPRLFLNKDSEKPVRIWHACCASGEEAYSVAMLIQEHLEKENLQIKVQIFATDLDEAAMAKGRAGIYADDVTADIGEERLKRFFVRGEKGWRVTKQLREMIVFAHHNLIKDPPFSRIDLLVCRNFLIYVNPDLQKLLIPLFHQVLNPGGFLFLGSAETVGPHSSLFTPIDKKWRIFMRQGGKSRADVLVPFFSPIRKLTDFDRFVPCSEAQEKATVALADKYLMERYVPSAHVVINEKNEVVHFSNQAGQYMLTPGGKPTRDLLKMAREELRPSLRAATYKAFTTQNEFVYRGVKVQTDGGEAAISIIAAPLKESPSNGKLALVIFEPDLHPATPPKPDNDLSPDDAVSRDFLVRQLEEQLRVTGEQLQSTSEQLEGSNERFMSANEELMTVNEELQSTNEELQSTNEELVTVNSELQKKMEELNQSNNDLENLFSSSQIATIFLDRELTIKRFSPAMAAICDLIPADIGRSFRYLSDTIDWKGFPREAATVLDKLVPVEKEVNSLKDDRTFVKRILPYRTQREKVDGIVVTLVDISERKRAEQALREGDERLRFALENCHIGACEIDMVNNNSYRSQEHKRIFGYNEASPEWTLQTLLNHIFPEDRARVEQIIQQGIASRKGWSFECRIRRTEGQIRWIWGAGRPNFDIDGGIRRLTGVIQDITDRKETEEENRRLARIVQQEKDRLSALFNSISDEIWFTDTEKRFTLANPSALRSFGFDGIEAIDMEKFIADLQVSRADGSSRPIEKMPAIRALGGETVTNIEEIIRIPATGELRHREVSANPVKDADGKITGAVSVIRDITERRRAESAQHKSERLYRSLFDNMLNGFAYCKMLYNNNVPEDFIYLNVNDSFETLTGLHNVIGKKVSEIIPGIQESDPVLFEIYGRVARTGKPERFEVHVEALEMWFSISVYSPQKDHFVAIFDVITERKKAEESLRLSEQRRSLALEASQAGTWEWNLHTNANIWSKELWPLYGLTRNSCTPSYEAWLKTVHPEDEARIEKTIRKAVARHIDFSVEWRGKSTDGKQRWLMSRGQPVQDGSDRVVRYAGIVMDITDRKRAEEETKALHSQLVQAQKLEAIGTLAGGIAHDFNNILGAILGYTELAKAPGLSHPERDETLDKVLEAGHRATDLVRQILAFSRQTNTENIPVNPVQLVNEAIKLLRPALPTTITIKQQLASATSAIFADPTRIHQIMMNLCTNAFHAMEKTGGDLEITLEDYELSQRKRRSHPGQQKGKYVRLSITDTGSGIAHENMDKIFNPYFTTKEMGRGTGLGLAIVHGIVSDLGGSITCESSPGKGTTFHVLFPAFEVQEPDQITHADLDLSGSERILLVDDEVALARLGKTMLERLGYKVTSCTGSLEALAIFREQPDSFDAIVTDQTMPKMTGSELAGEMLRIQPDIPIILCTGYSSIINEEQAKSLGIKGFAMKPLAKNELATLLRRVLEDQLSN